MYERLPTRIKTVKTTATRKSPRSARYSPSSGARSSSRTTPYPVPSTTPASSSALTEDGSYSTAAFSVARFTLAARTPAVPDRAFSTRRAHAAHVIPETGTEILRPSLITQSSIRSCHLQVTIPPYPIQGTGRFLDLCPWVG